MTAFFIVYLTGWWGLGLFFVLSLFFGYLVRRVLRWVWPRSYSDITRHDEIVIEAHYDFAEFVSALLFLTLVFPTWVTTSFRPMTLFSLAVTVVCLLVGYRAVVAALYFLAGVKHLRSTHEESIGVEF